MEAEKIMQIPWLKFGGMLILTGIIAGIGLVFFRGGFDRSPLLASDETVSLSDGQLSIRIDNARIVSSKEYILSAPYAAKVDTLLVEEGDMLSTSGSVVKLDTVELELELKKYESELARERAIVEKLKQGTRYEELVIFQQKKKSAESAKKEAEQSATQILRNAFVSADDAVRNQTDPIFTDPGGSDPQMKFTLTDTGLEATIERDRKALSDRLDDWKDLSDTLDSGNDIAKKFDKTESHIRSVEDYLDKVALAVNGLSAGAMTQDEIDTYKVATLLARTNVSVSATADSEARVGYVSAKQGALVAVRDLDFRLAGSAKQDIEAALDASDAARSQTEVIAERLKQAHISTPEKNLLIKKILPKKGEFVMAGAPVVIAASPDMEIEADIPEEDMRGISIGSDILFRLKAFSEEDIRGKLIKIENQEIEKGGSVYFRVRASIDLGSLGSVIKLRSGMTGDLIVKTSERGKIILIPKEFVSSRDGLSLVQTITTDAGAVKEKVVETGMSQGGDIAILSGLSIGEHLVK